MSDTARIPDDEWKIRARLGRAFGIWMGGLDGPAPSVEELEAWAKDAARLRDGRPASAERTGRPYCRASAVGWSFGSSDGRRSTVARGSSPAARRALATS